MKTVITTILVLIVLALPIFAIAQVDTTAALVTESTFSKVITNILGTSLDTAGYISAFFFAGLGLFLRSYYKTMRGIKNNPYSPDKFNLGYYLKNNLLSKCNTILFTIVVIFLGLRFPEMFGVKINFTIELFMLLGLLLGLFFDWFSDKLKKMQTPPIPVTQEQPVEGNRG